MDVGDFRGFELALHEPGVVVIIFRLAVMRARSCSPIVAATDAARISGPRSGR